MRVETRKAAARPVPKITFRFPDGSETLVDVPAGTSVMQAAVSHDIDGIVAECGGNALCATCHVYVDPSRLDELPPMREDENEMLELTLSPREENSRLSCQIPVTLELDGLVVALPAEQA